MMRGCYRWIRVVLPPPPWVGVVVFVWIVAHSAIVIFPLLIGFLLHIPIDGQMILVAKEVGPFYVILLSFGALVYGVFRASFFHPALSSDYRAWLRQSPWTPQQALPKGPVHLVWQDAMILGLFFAMPAAYAWPKICYVPAAFLVGYGATLTLVNWQTSEDLAVQTAIVLAGVIVLLLPIPWATLLAVSAAAAIAIAGALHSFGDFPWDASFCRRRLPKLQSIPQSLTATYPEEPYHALSAVPLLGPRVGIAEAASYSAMTGWLAWTMAFHARDDFQFAPTMAFIVTWACCCLGVGRAVRYANSRWWPISLPGRILALRVAIMPRYDRILVAPLITMAVGLLVYPLHRWLDAPMLLVGPLVLALAVFITLAAPPTLEQWHFTGHYRLNDKLTQRRGQFEQL